MRGLAANQANHVNRYAYGVALSLLLALSLALAAPGRALAATAPSLGAAQSFAVLGASTVTNTGPTVVNGDLGVSPGSAVTGFPPGTVTGGAMHVADAVALQAQNDTATAFVSLENQPCDLMLTGQDLGGKTLTPGVYCYTSSAQLTGTLTLDAQGNANAVFIFKTGSTLTTASASTVQMINSGSPCNVFWQVGSSATIGTTTTFVGNILARNSISLTTGASVAGRALARTAAVTMDTNNVSFAACSAAVTPTPVTPAPATATAPAAPGTTIPGTTVPATTAPAPTSPPAAPPADTPPAATSVPSTPAAVAPVSTPTPASTSPVAGVPTTLPAPGATAVMAPTTPAPAAPVAMPTLPNTGGGGMGNAGLAGATLLLVALAATALSRSRRRAR